MRYKLWDYVWGIIALVVMLTIFGLFITGCTSPTDPDRHDCTYYVEYDKWIGADCEQENDDAS
jgi:hypothetical protein